MKEVEVELKDGTIVVGHKFNKKDYKKLKKIFNKWVNINEDLKELGGRNLNVPDILSEGLYCIVFNAVRTNGTAYSYDAVDKRTGEGVQIKSSSIANDCTSFGPTSTWDKLIYMDFAPNGYVDGNIWFYQIESDEIYDIVLNKSKGETFRDQQLQGRRPRFSLKKEIIEKVGLEPVKKINLME